MALPSVTEVEQSATVAGGPGYRNVAYAFAAVTGRVGTKSELDGFHNNQVSSLVQQWSSVSWLIEAFATAHRRLPTSRMELLNWGQAKGVLDASFGYTGHQPQPGEGYSGGNPIAQIQAFWESSPTNKAILVGAIVIGYKLLSGRRGLL